MPVITIHTLLEMNNLINREIKPIMVKYSASWCNPCKTITPFYQQLASDPEYNSCVFVEIDVDEVPSLAEKYSISCMPTFQLLINGEVSSEFSGASKDKLLRILSFVNKKQM